MSHIPGSPFVIWAASSPSPQQHVILLSVTDSICTYTNPLSSLHPADLAPSLAHEVPHGSSTDALAEASLQMPPDLTQLPALLTMPLTAGLRAPVATVSTPGPGDRQDSLSPRPVHQLGSVSARLLPLDGLLLPGPSGDTVSLPPLTLATDDLPAWKAEARFDWATMTRLAERRCSLERSAYRGCLLWPGHRLMLLVDCLPACQLLRHQLCEVSNGHGDSYGYDGANWAVSADLQARGRDLLALLDAGAPVNRRRVKSKWVSVDPAFESRQARPLVLTAGCRCLHSVPSGAHTAGSTSPRPADPTTGPNSAGPNEAQRVTVQVTCIKCVYMTAAARFPTRICTVYLLHGSLL
ncbi:unnamed protein product [Protopolystoma xenopodis]|uniref:Uncharacterized protein n=1 Tax=Protopolystoma xenopodis TaxID=117903 RepID=A0A3S5ALB6_9PLAT|nr:unnamed protein product [Protopolystoma xenopodis]